MTYKIKLDTFEGPFDLMVYLIEHSRMDIYDIQISEITGQYLEYIEKMKELDVNLGSEFLVLAAQLIEIKTRMLLPRNKEEGDGVVLEDPRDELVQKLLEYRKFKEISEVLKKKEEEALCIYEKPQEDISEYTENPDELLDIDTAQFVKAFGIFLHKKKKVEEVRKRYVRIQRERETTENKMAHIRNVFRLGNVRKVSFKELVTNALDKYDVVLSFTSVLEMMKARQLDAHQKVTYGEITVEAVEDFTDDN